MGAVSSPDQVPEQLPALYSDSACSCSLLHSTQDLKNLEMGGGWDGWTVSYTVTENLVLG